MNRLLLPLILSAIVVPAILTIYLYDSAQFSDSLSTQSDGILGQGHFTITVRDSMGVVQSFQQTDNAVLNTGENCIAKMIFRDPGNAGTVVCAGATDEGWNYLCLDEDPQIFTTDSELRNPADEAGLATCRQGAITWNQNSTAGTDALSKVTLRLATTFTNSGSSETIAAVGVFNSSTVSTNSMLSKANFTATAVPNGGTLTVNYDYEVGGGTVP